MKPLILFGDRISHPSRACLMLMKSNPGLNFEEKSVSLFKGEQHKLKELPLKQIPVLHHGDKVIAQSTTILRYTASNFCEKFWYEYPKTRFLVDEYFDFWQVRSLTLTFISLMLFTLSIHAYKNSVSMIFNIMYIGDKKSSITISSKKCMLL